MATRSFKPKASSNLIEGVNPVTDPEETPAVVEDDEADVTPVTPEVDPTPNAEEEETTPHASSVTFEDKTSTPIEKKVKVCLRAKHSCTIGGVHYHFEKGKQYTVPVSVKTILLQADLLMPL